MKTSFIAGVIAAGTCSFVLSGCGGAQPAITPAPTVAPASSAATTTPPSSTPTPELKDYSKDDLEQLMVTEKQLGKPWDAGFTAAEAPPDQPNTCPTKGRSDLKIKRTAWYLQTFGYGKSEQYASVHLSALPDTDASALKSALLKDLKACTDFETKYKYGTYTVVSYTTDKASGPKTLPGTDEVLVGYTRRYYADAAHKVVNAEVHRVVFRTGQVIGDVYVGSNAKPGAKVKSGDKLLSTVLEQQASAIAGASTS